MLPFPDRKGKRVPDQGKSVSIIFTVLNEETNIGHLVNAIAKMNRSGNGWYLHRLIFADGGSTDNTIRNIESAKSILPDIQFIITAQKVKPGTAPATIEASLTTDDDWIMVMDADLQHPVHRIPAILDVKAEGYNLVIASRNMEGGRISRTFARGAVSRGAEILCRLRLKSSRGIRDPLSGFFVADASLISELVPRSGLYKLLLYILASSNDLKVKEVPYSFGKRIHGKSKLTSSSTHFMRRYLKELSYYRKIAKR